jgi:hypothetical protein
MHLMNVAGLGRHGAVVAWLVKVPKKGYAAYVRRFSLSGAWLTDPVRLSRQFGRPRMWPGDTIGISALSSHHRHRIVMSWGSAYGQSKVAQIWAATGSFR